MTNRQLSLWSGLSRFFMKPFKCPNSDGCKPVTWPQDTGGGGGHSSPCELRGNIKIKRRFFFFFFSFYFVLTATTLVRTWPCWSAAPGGSRRCWWSGWAEKGAPEPAGAAGAAEDLRSPKRRELTARTLLRLGTALWRRIMTGEKRVSTSKKQHIWKLLYLGKARWLNHLRPHPPLLPWWEHFVIFFLK